MFASNLTIETIVSGQDGSKLNYSRSRPNRELLGMRRL